MAPDNSEIETRLRLFARGEGTLASLTDLIQVDLTNISFRVVNPSGACVELQLEDVASGLLKLHRRFQDLRIWATILLVDSDLFDLEDRFETDRRGDMLLEALWDISFGENLEPKYLATASELLQSASKTSSDSGSS